MCPASFLTGTTTVTEGSSGAFTGCTVYHRLATFEYHETPLEPARLPMRLLIISHMPHHRRGDGRIVGWGPTVQELDHLATRFSVVRHIACLHEGEPPASFLPYRDHRVQLVPVHPSGGDHFRDKLGALAATPSYFATILRELPHADMVHLRCPANVPMVAAALLPFLRRPRARWIKYAGNWRPARHDSYAYKFQRWLLSTPWHHGLVTINGNWPGQPRHIRSFYNPSLGDDELAAAAEVARSKRPGEPMQLLFAGRLDAAKGAGTAIETVAALRDRGIAAHLALAGDGPDRASYEQLAAQLGVADRVTFEGWLARTEMPSRFARAHFVVLPTGGEGWPKVLSEGMAYGAVPVATAVGAIPQYLAEFGVGRALPAADPQLFAAALAEYAADHARWQREAAAASDLARYFTYAYYLERIDEMLAELKVA